MIVKIKMGSYKTLFCFAKNQHFSTIPTVKNQRFLTIPTVKNQCFLTIMKIRLKINTLRCKLLSKTFTYMEIVHNPVRNHWILYLTNGWVKRRHVYG